jgi:hypothetical protein
LVQHVRRLVIVLLHPPTCTQLHQPTTFPSLPHK